MMVFLQKFSSYYSHRQSLLLLIYFELLIQFSTTHVGAGGLGHIKNKKVHGWHVSYQLLRGALPRYPASCSH